MAIQSVANSVPSGFILPYDEMNRAGELLAQARGIAAAVGIASKYEDQLPENSLSHACWAIQELLNQVERITEMKHGEAVA